MFEAFATTTRLGPRSKTYRLTASSPASTSGGLYSMKPCFSLLLHLACTALLLISSSEALFEDQQGNNDWYRSSIGRVKSAKLHSRKPRLSLATHSNILATLNLRDGEVLWRQKFPEDEQLDGLSVCEKSGLVFTLSGGGGTLRAWDQLHGESLWEKPLEKGEDNTKWEPGAASLVEVWERADEPMVVVLDDGALKAFDVRDGEELWSVDVDSELESVTNAALEVASNGFLVGLVDARADRAQLISISNQGDIVQSKTFAQSIPLSEKIALSANALIVASKDGLSGCTGHFESADDLSCEEFPNGGGSDVFVSGAGLVSLSESAFEGSAMVGLKGPHILPGVTAISSLVQEDGTQLLGLITITKEGMSISVVGAEDVQEVHSEAYNGFQVWGTVGPLGVVEQVFLGKYARKDGSVGYRALLVGQDDSVSLLQQGHVVWTREEGLASIKSTLFIDPPAAPGIASQKVDVMKRVRIQVLMLKQQFHLMSEIESLELDSLKREVSGQNLNARDANGLRKLIVSVSSTKVYALHSGDGHIVWSRMLERESAFSRIVLYRYSHNLQEAPWVALLSKRKCLILNAHNGNIIEVHDLPGGIEKIIELPKVARVGDSDQHVFMLVLGNEETGLKGQLLPNIPASRELLDTMVGGVNIWTSNNSMGVLRGYHLCKKQMEFSEQWRLVLHSSILTTTARDPGEAIHSHVKVLGDRTLKYKYLNPNTLFVACGLPDGKSSVTVDSDDVDLSIHIIDTITGRILFRQVHPGARGPVHVVFSQHYIVYHYWSLRNGRYEVSVLELYDASHKNIDIWKLMFFPDATHEKMSSHEPVPLEVLRSTHFTSTSVKALAVTRTLRGITTQRVLIGTVLDQVYAMDRRFLDPRRPRGKITAEAREDRLIPYQENLFFYPTHYASQDRQILGLKHIESAATGLESASHVLAYGIDIFYSKIQPEKAFDSLEEDFAFGFLVLTIAAMLVGVVVMHHTVKRSKIMQKWK